MTVTHIEEMREGSVDDREAKKMTGMEAPSYLTAINDMEYAYV